MTAFPNKHTSRFHAATQEEDDQRTQSGKEILRRRCGQLDTSTAGGRWRRQHCRAQDGEEWSVACVPPGVTRLNYYSTS